MVIKWIFKTLNSNTENDEMYVWGINNMGQLGLGDFTNGLEPTLNPFFKDKKIIKMECGDYHTIALFGKTIHHLIHIFRKWRSL